MRSSTPPDLHGRCPRCWLREEWCVCDAVPLVRTSLRFVIVRHVKERFRSSNTGRAASLALPDVALLEHGAPGVLVDPTAYGGPDTVLLFPPDDGAPDVPADRFRTVVVLDGTWGQARRMSHRLPGVHTLPRLSLPPPAARVETLRRPHAPWARATIEAIAAVVELVDGPEVALPLRTFHAEFVRRARLQRGARPA